VEGHKDDDLACVCYGKDGDPQVLFYVDSTGFETKHEGNVVYLRDSQISMQGVKMAAEMGLELGTFLLQKCTPEPESVDIL
jgi:hypothetical protein